MGLNFVLRYLRPGCVLKYLISFSSKCKAHTKGGRSYCKLGLPQPQIRSQSPVARGPSQCYRAETLIFISSLCIVMRASAHYGVVAGEIENLELSSSACWQKQEAADIPAQLARIFNLQVRNVPQALNNLAKMQELL